MLRAAKVLSLIRARAILSSPLPVGICIFGDPLHDKTSLAWVAMRTVLPGWSCVQWPHRSRHPEGIETMVGGRVVLWLDDLHEYANRVEAAQLEFLLDRFAQRGVLVVVVATCNWHDDEHEARARLGNLFDLLLPIRLPEQSSGIIDTDLERDLAEKRHDYASLLEGVMNRHRRVRRIGE
jgi:hypothetical protein